MKRPVKFYKISHNPQFRSFPVGPNMIFQEKLNFVYMENDKEVSKIIPLSYIGPHLGKKKVIIKTDEETGISSYKGEFYIIPESLIFNYHD